MKKLFICLLSATLLLVTACKQNFDLDPVGESVEQFSNISPESFAKVVLNKATPTAALQVTWGTAKPGIDKAVTYKWQVDLPNADFSAPLASLPSDNAGVATKITFTQKQVDDLLASKGIAVGASVQLKWRVEATNGDYSRYSSPSYITITRMGTDGLNTFGLTAPANNLQVSVNPVLDPNGGVTLTWDAATTVSGTGTVAYTLLFRTATGTFEVPLYSKNVGGVTTYFLSNQEIKTFIGNNNLLIWTVKATANGLTSYSNENYLRVDYQEVNTLNIIGEAGLGWGTDLPLNKVADGKFSKLTSLLNGKEFKFRKDIGSWDWNWGYDGSTFNLGQSYQLVRNGSNIKLPGDSGSSIYKVDVDFTTNSFVVTQFNAPTNLYLVGGSTPANWDPSNSVPFRNDGIGKFELFAPLTVSGSGYKFLEVQDWAGDWGCQPGNPGGIVQNNEDNCNVAVDGFYRIYVDFTTLTQVTEPFNIGVIGSASPGGWGSDTNMIQTGTYTWSLTTALTAGEIKFRANDSWDYNFGDNGADGTLERNGSNIAVATAGTYTITFTLHPTNGYTYTVSQ